MISWMITGLAKLLPWRDSTIVRTATYYTDTDTTVTYPRGKVCVLGLHIGGKYDKIWSWNVEMLSSKKFCFNETVETDEVGIPANIKRSVNAGPSSSTLAQHWLNSCACSNFFIYTWLFFVYLRSRWWAPSLIITTGRLGDTSSSTW